MYTCHGTRNGLPDPHQHEKAEDAKVCYGILPSKYSSPVLPPYTGAARMATERQIKYIGDLGGDTVHAYKLTVHEASEYINKLKKEKSMAPSAPTAERPESPYDKKLKMVTGLLDLVPDGYFAVQEYEGGHITFLRISSPTNGRYKGSRKFQYGVGSGVGLRLETVAVYWPSKRWSVFKSEFVEAVMLLCADYQTAALRYAEKMGKCCRCNAPLTDGRSRWYGIGPECETHWPWIIDWVTDARGPFTGER